MFVILKINEIKRLLNSMSQRFLKQSEKPERKSMNFGRIYSVKIEYYGKLKEEPNSFVKINEDDCV